MSEYGKFLETHKCREGEMEVKYYWTLETETLMCKLVRECEQAVTSAAYRVVT